jgi:hypothetical protein
MSYARWHKKLDTLAQEVLALNQLYKSISLGMKSKYSQECETVETTQDIIEKHKDHLFVILHSQSFGLIYL